MRIELHSLIYNLFHLCYNFSYVATISMFAEIRSKPLSIQVLSFRTGDLPYFGSSLAGLEYAKAITPCYLKVCYKQRSVCVLDHRPVPTKGIGSGLQETDC